jgi:hypothetical protein
MIPLAMTLPAFGIGVILMPRNFFAVMGKLGYVIVVKVKGT